MRFSKTAFALAIAMAAAAPAAPAKLPTISVKHGTTHEEATKQQLLDLLARYDTSQWTFTNAVLIDRTAIPHSHPVLTIHTRDVSRPMRLLAAYLHENIHWWLSDRHESTTAAIEELRQIYPSAPVGYPKGAQDEYSTYLHLIVCWLENEAMIDVAGPPAAAEVLEAMTDDHYTWVYQRVRDENDVLARVVRKHRLDPRISGTGISSLRTGATRDQGRN